jgi:hypothetical protein
VTRIDPPAGHLTIHRDVERGSLLALHVGGRLVRIDPTDFCRRLESGTE